MVKFERYSPFLIFIHYDNKCIGCIEKYFKRRLYTVIFYGNREIKSCTTRTLLKAKEIVYDVLGVQ